MGSMEDAFRKAGLTPAPPETLPEKACARCGKMFRPGRPQHKLCDECATAARAERGEPAARVPETAARLHESAAKPDSGKPAEPGAATAPLPAAEAPRPRREPPRERPPRRAPERAQESGPARVFVSRELPRGYLENGYLTPSGALHRELLTTWAEQIAQAVAGASSEATAHQVHLFANHVRRAVASLKSGGTSLDRLLNEVRKLKAFAMERAARRKVPDVFRRFIEANVDRVTDEKSLRAFAEHFQAVEAYAGGLLQMRKERR